MDLQIFRNHWEKTKLFSAFIIFFIGFGLIIYSSSFGDFSSYVKEFGNFIAAVGFLQVVYEIVFKKIESDLHYEELSQLFDCKLETFNQMTSLDYYNVKNEEIPANNIKNILANKKNIIFIAIALSNIVDLINTTNNRDLLVKRFLIDKEFKIEFFFLDPESELIKYREKELENLPVQENLNIKIGQLKKIRKSIVERNSEIENRIKDNFKIYTYDVIPKIAMTKIDDEVLFSPYFISEKGSESVVIKPRYDSSLYNKCLEYAKDIKKFSNEISYEI